MVGLIQHLDVMASPLRGEALVGAKKITLPRVETISDEANAVVAYAIAWALREAGASVTNPRNPADFDLPRVISDDQDTVNIRNEFAELKSFTLFCSTPLTQEQLSGALQKLEEFKRYVGSDWHILDAEQARKNYFESSKGQAGEPQTVEDTPPQPHQIIKWRPSTPQDRKMHDVLYHYLKQVALEGYPSLHPSTHFYEPDPKLFWFSGRSDHVAFTNPDDMQPALDRAAGMLGASPRLLTQKRPNRAAGV